MGTNISKWLMLLVGCLHPKLTWSAIVEGELITAQNWAFLTRFCFLSKKGLFEYTIEYNKEYEVQNLLYYYDTAEQWPSAYRKGLSCEQKESYLNISQVFNMSELYFGDCYISNVSILHQKIITCNGKTTFNTARERWWYIAISNCKATKVNNKPHKDQFPIPFQGLKLKYQFVMTNGMPGDFWFHHFSADELYILPILISFFLVYVFILVAIAGFTVELKQRQLFHTTYKMFVVSVILQEIGIILQIAAYFKYALNGKGYPSIKTQGRILESASEIVFLLLLLLIAKGFTVTRGRLRLASSVKITIFMCLYVITFILLFTFERLFFDPGKVLYLYESPAGYGLIVLRVFAWWLFVYSIVFTLKHYPEKVVFYYPFNMFGTLWFVAGPTFILIANAFIDKWVKESVVCGVLHFISLCGHSLFLFMTMPSRVNKIFPYHIRTSQIGVMKTADINGTLPFSHHPYDLPPPSSDSGTMNGTQPIVGEWMDTGVPVELFTVSQTMEERVDEPKPHATKELTPVHQRTEYSVLPEQESAKVLDMFCVRSQTSRDNNVTSLSGSKYQGPVDQQCLPECRVSVNKQIYLKMLIMGGIALVASLHIQPASGKYVEGKLVTWDNWAFLARFCFLSEQGLFEYVIEYDKEYAVQNLLLYYDTDEQWPSAYKPGLTCEEKESFLNISRQQVVNLTDQYSNSHVSGCEARDISHHKVMKCHRSKRFRTARERWWFLAISNCNATKGLNLRYKFLMTNGPPGDFWHEHFSADEFYILPILMCFCLIYLFMILAVVICSVELKHRQLFHTTYKLFFVSVVLQQLGIIMQSCAYIKFAVDGLGFPRTRMFGRMLESASETVFLLLLLLLAKGFTVTRGRLRLGSSIKLTIFMCLYIITYIVLFIYERLFFDPGMVLYLYESPAGYGLILLRIGAWGMFVYSIVFTLKHYPEKALFYYPFNMLGTLWFIAGPGFILAANMFIDKWVRESVVYGVLHFIALCGHLIFLFMTLPSRANKVFPYHVRTSQIGVMEVAGPDTTLPFTHHMYAPSAPPGNAGLGPGGHPVVGEWVSDVPLELFCVSRAVAMNTTMRMEVLSPKPYLVEDLKFVHRRDDSIMSDHEPVAVPDVFQAQSQVNRQPSLKIA